MKYLYVFAFLITFVAITPLYPQAQDDLRLPLHLSIENLDEDAPFTRDQLDDSLVVSLSAKPVRLLDNAFSLVLYVNVLCFDEPRVCRWLADMRIYGSGGGSPVKSTSPVMVFWNNGGLLSGPELSERIRAEILSSLDEPLAAWLRLSERERACWVKLLEQPIFAPFEQPC